LFIDDEASHVRAWLSVEVLHVWDVELKISTTLDGWLPFNVL
jgi:hypothetical protein